MKLQFKILLSFLILSSCCFQTKNTPFEEVLELAGSNRHELEKVFSHYRKNTSDSLKLKAAEYLILNMPGKYSEYYEAPWEDVATVNLRWSSSSDKESVLDTYKLGNTVRKDDINHITAEFLISNIDLAFQVWQDKPWGKFIPFDTFCEEILPYRIGTEPLENWREKALASFADINKYLKNDSTITAVEACRRVNDLLPRFRLDKDFSNMSFTQLMATTRGMCDSQATLAAFVMRALGIPITIDFTPQWKKIPTGHTWNSVRDRNGQHISFMGTETNPYDLHQGNLLRKAKVYRKTFTISNLIETVETDTPPLFRDNITDISSEHENMTSIIIPIRFQPQIQTGYAYLALFLDFEWHLTGHTKTDPDSIHFKNIGNDILYLPVFYTNENQTSAGDPFYVDQNGMAHILSPYTPDSLMSFHSIALEDDLVFSERMVDGVFEISNNPDFQESKIIHRVSETPRLHNRVIFNQPYTCRYVRYKSPPSGYCNVSEITFHDISGNEIKGVHIGPSGSYNDLGGTGEKAFDGGILSFYDSIDPDNSWTGLDFGENKKIAYIHYSPRLYGCGIYEGCEYELFCWSDNGWKSVEEKKATKKTIEFNAPRNALYYLYNKTTKNKGQVFFILGDNLYYYDLSS